jgi:tryptophanyl-tRNA synthetase
MAKKGKIFSGMRPTGKLHIGHLVGALNNWINMQDEYECVFGIVDWHALTTGYQDLSELQTNIRELAIDYICAGIDPEKSIIMIQSQVKEHAELHLLLSMITPTPWLIRNPTVKEQARDMGLIDEGEDEMTKIDYGHLGYPVLQSADILVYLADTVPVGEDQVPHIEICREIARRFNHLYGKVFPEPKEILTQTPRLLGADGRKMSKSYGNAIFIADTPEEIWEKVRKMITDPEKLRLGDPGRPKVCSVFDYHKVFNEEEVESIRENCKSGDLGCVACKKNLASKMAEFLAPYRQKRKELENNPDYIDNVLKEGTDAAREQAADTMKKVRDAMNLM